MPGFRIIARAGFHRMSNMMSAIANTMFRESRAGVFPARAAKWHPAPCRESRAGVAHPARAA